MATNDYTIPNARISLFISLFVLYLLPPTSSVYFQFTRFNPDATNILYQGDAVPSVGAIEFNKVNYLCRVGWATYRINNNSIASTTTTRWNASFHSGDTTDAWITYNATTKNLTVFWSYERTPNSQENTSLSYQIDLMEVLPEWVMVGFSAATGMYVERHTLQSWEFRSSLDIKEKSGKSAKEIRLVVGLTVSVGVLVLGGIIAAIILWKKRLVKRKKAEMMNLTSINDDLERGAGPRSFGVVVLEIATGRKSVDPTEGKSHIGLVQWVWELYGGGQLLSAVDERLYVNYDVKEIECLMIVGLWCAYPDHSLRPSIRQAIQVLHLEAPMPNLPLKMPVPMYHPPSTSVSSSEPTLTNTSMEIGR
ncbi:concanavalin A-like lectin protein kinase family protein [Actinidia rufa]|uniref:Concanavalin A-like lectin protein kinase family protein n=1 Tax=Actinidia rufa TaxID=165716 RepID=A0A7J0EQ45_9ERIC|nr:concanavalin A-like lectin protein kinase family protein [Actinidia rufa]